MSVIQDASQQYWTCPAFFAAFIGALVYLAFQWRDKHYGLLARTIVILSVVVLVFIYNPVFYNVASKFNGQMSGTATYARVFLFVPLFPALISAMVIFIEKNKDRLHANGAVLIVVFALLIVGFGTTVADNGVYIKAHNAEKLHPDAVEISDLVRADVPKGQRPHIYLQSELSSFRDSSYGGIMSGIREYYSDALFTGNLMNDEIYQANYNPESYAAYLQDLTANDSSAYLVLNNATDEAAAVEAAGGELLGKTSQKSLVYRIKKSS